MPSRFAATFAAAVVGACQSGADVVPPTAPVLATAFVDQTPAEVQRGWLDAVVVLYDSERRLLASGIVVAPGRVLTASHVVDHMPAPGEGDHALLVDGRPRRVRVVERGDADAPHGDWAILAFDAAEPLPQVVLHAPALAADWAPAVGTEVLLVGYAAGFFADGRIDASAPPPSRRVRICPAEPDGRRWLAEGEAVDLGGMSGGAAMVWDPRTGRAEVIGVFRGYVGSHLVREEQLSFLGIPVGTRRTPVEGIAFEIHRLPAAALARVAR